MPIVDSHTYLDCVMSAAVAEFLHQPKLQQYIYIIIYFFLTTLHEKQSDYTSPKRFHKQHSIFHSQAEELYFDNEQSANCSSLSLSIYLNALVPLMNQIFNFYLSSITPLSGQAYASATLNYLYYLSLLPNFARASLTQSALSDNNI